jgi:hypothetical protein
MTLRLMGAATVLVGLSGVAVAVVHVHEGPRDRLANSVGCAGSPFTSTGSGSAIFRDNRDFLDPEKGVFRARASDPQQATPVALPPPSTFKGAQAVYLDDVAAQPTSATVAAWYSVDQGNSRPFRLHLVLLRHGHIRQTIAKG